MSNIHKFSVIEGGIKPKEKCEKRFVSAYITDTRLMGAMGMFVHWEVLNCDETNDFIQYFYFDTEELGLENYISLWKKDRMKMYDIEHTSIGCLGGKKIDLSEKEACYMVSYYHNMTVRLGKKLNKNFEEYKFILDKDISLNSDELDILVNKICTDITSVNQTIHYFLMRVFGRDFIGAKYLLDSNAKIENLDLFPDFGISNFCKNTISKRENQDSINNFGEQYLCESIVNYKNSYYICTSLITVADLKIVYAQSVGNFQITNREAALILNRSEYISVFAPNDMDDDHSAFILELPYSSNSTDHINGKLIMVFRNNNNHVKKSVFNISDDIIGTIFITPIGQLIITSYTENDVERLENSIINCDKNYDLEIVGRFVFGDSIFHDFVDSPFDDFIQFINIGFDEDL